MTEDERKFFRVHAKVVGRVWLSIHEDGSPAIEVINVDPSRKYMTILQSPARYLNTKLVLHCGDHQWPVEATALEYDVNFDMMRVAVALP